MIANYRVDDGRELRSTTPFAFSVVRLGGHSAAADDWAAIGTTGAKQKEAVGGNAAGASIETRLERIVANIDTSQQRMEIRLAVVESRQARLESLLIEVRDLFVHQRTFKDWYSPVEVADILGKKPYTVREWCRLQRVKARKRPTGRGDADEREISHDELERIKNHGLLPIPTKY